MDKDNKYFALIENLVRNHKKFKGYEAIIDDIIEDVFSHSQVILNSVENEDVVRAYLTKVVSTSLITVPKKMNFHKEVSRGSVNISSILKQTDSNKNEEVQSFEEETDAVEVEKTEKAEKVNTEYVDKMINMADMAETEIDNEGADLELLDDVVTVEEEDINNEFENSSEELSLTPEVSLDNEIVENDDVDSIDVVDENESVESLFLDDENNEPDMEKTEAILNTEDIETIEESAEEIESYVEAEPLQEDENIEISETVDEPDILETSDFEILDIDDTDDQDEELENNTIEGDVQTTESLIDDDADDVSPEETFIEDISPIEEISDFDDNLDLSLNDDIAIDNQNFIDDFDLQQEPLVDSLQDFEEDPVLLQDGIEERVDTDFGEQEADTNDAASLQEKLSELSSEYPDLEILDVCKLKYQENCSVEEVAKKLNLPEESVVKALNKVLELL